jgi:hypothetical protein
MQYGLTFGLVFFAACAPAPGVFSDDGGAPPDLLTVAGPPADLAQPAPEPPDMIVACSVSGVGGACMSTSDCAAMGQTSTAGFCPGPADIQCCTMTPSVSSNPPIPTGWKLMKQADVTADMTTWAVMILHDPVEYPMFSTTIKTFGSLMVLARVEWHPPDFQNSVVHRGVTLYEPI